MPRKKDQIEVLLRIRRRQEDLKAQALACAQREVNQAERERDMIVADQRRTLREAVLASREALDARKLLRFRQHERYLARLSVEKDAAIGELRQEAEGKRQELEGAMKHRKMVERLVERRDEAHQQALRKTEQKQTDEVAATKSAIKRMKGRAES